MTTLDSLTNFKAGDIWKASGKTFTEMVHVLGYPLARAVWSWDKEPTEIYVMSVCPKTKTVTVSSLEEIPQLPR